MDGAAHYDRYVAEFIVAYTRATVATLGPVHGRRVLDHGAGTGAVTAALVSASESVRVTALDPNREMLDRIEGRLDPDRAARVDRVVGRLGEVELVGPYDAVASQLVLMFVPEVIAELAALHALTVPGGQLVASVLGSPADIAPFSAYWRAARTVDGSLAAPERYAHVRFADPEQLAEQLRSAGWGRVDIARVESFRRLDDDELWAWVSGALPLLRTDGTFRGPLHDDEAARVRAALLDEVSPYRDAAGLTMPVHGWTVNATS